MPYNFAADSFHTKKLCSRLSSSEVHFLIEISHFAFLRPPLGDLRAMYDDHLRLIGKRVVDFLLALIELFSLGVTAEALRAIKCSFVWYINLDRSFYCFVTIHACDRQTDGRTEFSSLYRICITCSAVKN